MSMPLIGMRDRAAAPLPESHLEQLLRHALRLQGALADAMRPQQLDGGVHKRLARVAASAPCQPSIGVDLHQRMQVFVRVEALRPAPVRRFAEQGDRTDFCNLQLFSLLDGDFSRQIKNPSAAVNTLSGYGVF